MAVEGGMILGVGAVTDKGEITLNYVSPDARFRGVSRALLGALETERSREAICAGRSSVPGLLGAFTTPTATLKTVRWSENSVPM